MINVAKVLWFIVLIIVGFIVPIFSIVYICSLKSFSWIIMTVCRFIDHTFVLFYVWHQRNLLTIKKWLRGKQ